MSETRGTLDKLKLEMEVESNRHELTRLRNRVTFLENELRVSQDRAIKMFNESETSLLSQIDELKATVINLQSERILALEENERLKEDLVATNLRFALSMQPDPSHSVTGVAPTSISKSVNHHEIKQNQKTQSFESMASSKTRSTNESTLSMGSMVDPCTSAESCDNEGFEKEVDPVQENISGEENFIMAVVSVMSEPNSLEELIELAQKEDQLHNHVRKNNSLAYPPVLGFPNDFVRSDLFSDVTNPDERNKNVSSVGTQLLLRLAGLDTSPVHPNVITENSIHDSATRGVTTSEATYTNEEASLDDQNITLPNITDTDQHLDVANAVMSSSTLEGLSRRLHELNPTLFPIFEGEQQLAAPFVASANKENGDSSHITTFFEMIQQAARSLMSATNLLRTKTQLEDIHVDELARASLSSVTRAQQFNAELEEHKRQIAARVAQIQQERDHSVIKERELERRRELVARYLYRLYREASEAEAQAALESSKAALCPITQLRALKDKFLE